jgi:hypothetical protein
LTFQDLATNNLNFLEKRNKNSYLMSSNQSK